MLQQYLHRQIAVIRDLLGFGVGDGHEVQRYQAAVGAEHLDGGNHHQLLAGLTAEDGLLVLDDDAVALHELGADGAERASGRVYVADEEVTLRVRSVCFPDGHVQLPP